MRTDADEEKSLQAKLSTEIGREIYSQSIIRQKLQAQVASFGTNLVAFTDIDGTYIMEQAETTGLRGQSLEQERKHFEEATRRITYFLENNLIPVVAVTGRDLPLVQQGQSSQTEHLPFFDVIASDVGTIIWVRQEDGNYLQDQDYRYLIEQEYGFQREKVYPCCVELLRHIRKTFPSTQFEFQPRDRPTPEEGLTPQPYKISYTFSGNYPEAQIVKFEIECFLKTVGFGHLLATLSHDTFLTGTRSRYNLDILPLGKDKVVAYMAKTYGCVGIVAGDSGNDIDMLLDGDSELIVAGIIVGGSKPELNAAVKEIAILEDGADFKVVKTTQGKRLLYIENGKLKGPESLFQAVKLFKARQKASGEL